MRREGSPWTGVGAVVLKEMADHFSSARIRILIALIVLTAGGAVYAAMDAIRAAVGQDAFLFLRLFTVARDPMPSFAGFLGFLVPLIAIAVAFDAVNGEMSRRTMSRVLSQPIYRDAFLLGKFLGGLATIAVCLVALWLLVTGFGIITLGLPPSGPEIARSLAFLVVTIIYAGVWLALALALSVALRAAATSALAALAIWLVFAFFWSMLVPVVTNIIVPRAVDPQALLAKIHVAQILSRLSPNTLFGESAVALLHPATRSLGPVFTFQLDRALVGAPLPFGQSLLIIWPELVGLAAAVVILFTIAYATFQRQEIRA
jgi:ABC-2 type transport system permease protein